MQSIKRTFLQALIVSALCGPVFAQTSGAPIKVGAIVSVSGPLAQVGAISREGYQLAEKVINQRGGINGRPLQLVFEDDSSNPDIAVTKANGLLNSGVVALLGPTGLAATLATGGITAQKNVLQVTGAGIALPIERERKCLLHMMPAQHINAAGLLSYAVDGAKAKRVGVLYDSGVGQAVMNSMKDLAPKYGVTFVAAEKFDLAATDMSSQVAKLKASDPDLVMLLTSSPTPFRNLRQLNVNAPVVTGLAVAVYDSIKAMGPAAEGVVFAEYMVAEDPRPSEKEFVDLFYSEYKKLPKNFEVAAWEAVMVVADAIKKAGPDSSSDKICAAARSKHAGSHVAYDFTASDMTGIQLSSFQYSTVKDGKFVRLPFTAQDRP
ncbi:ABC transporter substrate-binding protein [Variovorax sp. dw_954]|uniref:ABC transporter substrate-binding protein n=1 Tax=Variovorax sp. dw_954 TaxID=2720078 RepID=UPI001BD1F613|nr:ABC transporter substrate-binding protein [Variovorax sp. dw_954]